MSTKTSPFEFSYALLTDLYQLTMMQGYFLSGNRNRAVFDLFFRRPPFQSGYAVFAGLETAIQALVQLRFSETDLAYLKSLGIFQPLFLDFLKNFSFSGNIDSFEEGDLVFPGEPLMRIEAPIMEAQLIETLLLNLINFQTLIATKTSRIVQAAAGRGILEFGLRRAQGIDGGISASRAAYIGGAAATSNVLAGQFFGIPVKGTMAHSWVMAYPTEEDAFDQYAAVYPDHTVLLVDTYNTLEKGVPAAIQTLKKLQAKGIRSFGIRLDSGDLEYLSKEARNLLDQAGLKEATITASNELDEGVIEELLKKQSPIDFFGVGTALVTGKSDAALSGVYKLAAKETASGYEPSMKISNNPEKTTNPHIKNVMRFFDKNGLMAGDFIFLEQNKEELENRIQQKEPFTFYHPQFPYEHFTLKEYSCAESKLKPVMRAGKPVISFPLIEEIRKRALKNTAKLHYTYRRLLNPHVYKVSLSRRLRDLKLNLMKQYRNGEESFSGF